MQTRDARVVPNSIERMRDVCKRAAACAGENVDTFPDEATSEAGVAPDASLGYLFHHHVRLCMTFYFVGGVGDDHPRGVDLGGCFAHL